MTTISLTGVVPGNVVVVVLPEGEWLTPPGWSRSGDTIRTTWTKEHGTEIVLTAPVPILCGLCGLDIVQTDDTLGRRGVSVDPDVHVVCFRKCVEVKVSAPGEIGSPWPTPVPAWGPDLTIVTGDLYTYQGSTYRALTNHVSKVGTPPPSDPKLWVLA